MRNPSTLLGLSLAISMMCPFARPLQAETVSVTPTASVSNYTLQTRNNSLSLLYSLLGDEKNVSKLLIIKKDRKQLHDVIKRISEGAKEAVKQIDLMAKMDSTINLKATNLPPGEQAARDAESKETTSELLHSKGSELEFKLLMTQAQAMGYGSNLAKVTAQCEPDANRRKAFYDLSTQLDGYYNDVVQLIRAPAVPASIPPPAAK